MCYVGDSQREELEASPKEVVIDITSAEEPGLDHTIEAAGIGKNRSEADRMKSMTDLTEGAHATFAAVSSIKPLNVRTKSIVLQNRMGKKMKKDMILCCISRIWLLLNITLFLWRSRLLLQSWIQEHLQQWLELPGLRHTSMDSLRNNSSRLSTLIPQVLSSLEVASAIIACMRLKFQRT